MALADTARLIASLELQDKFSGPAGRVDRSLSGMDRRVSSLGKAGATASRGISTLGRNVALLGGAAVVAGVGLLAANIKKGTDALHELENVQVATQTVLKSTNAISGQTAEGIRAMSEEYENLNATIDDKVIQSGANLLLTFTNIRTKAFEPALEAALNMNEAMGGGPEGLQSTIIQVGKALNDPVKGATALRRVGVQLSDQQQDQIKTLVEQNDLYGAQQVILKELGTEFGGRFAAAGKTAEGRMATLGDRVEDLQKALAGPLQPTIDRVRDKLIDLLGSKVALGGAKDLGEAINDLFSEERLDAGISLIKDGIAALRDFDGSKIGANLQGVITGVGGLPWQSIADAAKLLGTGSKALLDAFLGLPPWVQTAVLTGWGLNKLTGGALGGIVGELSKGLIKGVLNMNAAVVNVNGKVVNGPGGVGGGGRGGIGGFVAGAVGTAAVGAAVAGGISKLGTQEETITVGLRDGDISKIAEAIDWSPGALIGRATQDLLEELGVIEKAQTQGDRTQAQRLQEGNRYAREQTQTILRGQASTDRNLTEGNRYAATLNSLTTTQGAANRASLGEVRGRIESGNYTLSQIRDKPSSFTTNVTVNNDLQVGISATGIAATLTRIALTTNQQQHTVPTVQ